MIGYRKNEIEEDRSSKEMNIIEYRTHYQNDLAISFFLKMPLLGYRKETK